MSNSKRMIHELVKKRIIHFNQVNNELLKNSGIIHYS